MIKPNVIKNLLSPSLYLPIGLIIGLPLFFMYALAKNNEYEEKIADYVIECNIEPVFTCNKPIVIEKEQIKFVSIDSSNKILRIIKKSDIQTK